MRYSGTPVAGFHVFMSNMSPGYVDAVFALVATLVKASCECLSPCKVVTRAAVQLACKWKGFEFPRG